MLREKNNSFKYNNSKIDMTMRIDNKCINLYIFLIYL